MQEHSGRSALVTGAGSGIGRATAELLGAEGASVAVTAPDLEAARAVGDAIVAAGGRAIAIAADVTDAAAMTDAVETAVAIFGGLDTLVTSAGIQRYGNVTDTDEKTWDEVFDVNVKGVFFTAQAALPHLRRSRAGSIVVISSVQAHVTQTDVSAYTASKGALNALVRSMAIDEAAHGVRVNAVCPGSVDTPMLRSSAAMFTDGSPAAVDGLVREWGRAHPLGRVAEPAEVAQVAAFLAGTRASFVTGADVPVDGGLLASIAVALPPGK